jgi:hypothetical protein
MTLVQEEPGHALEGRSWTSDIRPQILACLGLGLALTAALGMFLLDGAWLVVAACLLALGVVFAVVGIWADRKIRWGDFRRPDERGA